MGQAESFIPSSGGSVGTDQLRQALNALISGTTQDKSLSVGEYIHIPENLEFEITDAASLEESGRGRTTQARIFHDHAGGRLYRVVPLGDLEDMDGRDAMKKSHMATRVVDFVREVQMTVAADAKGLAPKVGLAVICKRPKRLDHRMDADLVGIIVCDGVRELLRDWLSAVARSTKCEGYAFKGAKHRDPVGMTCCARQTKAIDGMMTRVVKLFEDLARIGIVCTNIKPEHIVMKAWRSSSTDAPGYEEQLLGASLDALKIVNFAGCDPTNMSRRISEEQSRKEAVAMVLGFITNMSMVPPVYEGEQLETGSVELTYIMAFGRVYAGLHGRSALAEIDALVDYAARKMTPAKARKLYAIWSVADREIQTMLISKAGATASSMQTAKDHQSKAVLRTNTILGDIRARQHASSQERERQLRERVREEEVRRHQQKQRDRLLREAVRAEEIKKHKVVPGLYERIKERSSEVVSRSKSSDSSDSSYRSAISSD